MGRFVIVAYKPKAGHASTLDALLVRHLDVLREQGLITDREGVVMRSGDGTRIEVFEWRSADAIEEAHGNAAVGALWQAFSDACDYVPLSTLPETQRMFAEFDGAASA